MKIQNPTSTPIPDARPVTTKPTEADSSGSTRADKVTLERSQHIAVTASLSQERELRSARMKMLEVAVRNGTYRADTGLIAQRMLESSAFLEAVDDDLEREHAAPHAEVTP